MHPGFLVRVLKSRRFLEGVVFGQELPRFEVKVLGPRNWLDPKSNKDNPTHVLASRYVPRNRYITILSRICTTTSTNTCV